MADRRWVVGAVGVAVVLAAAAGIEWSRRGGVAPARGPVITLPPPEEPEETEEAEPARPQPASRLFERTASPAGARQPSEEGDISFAELVGLLGRGTKTPKSAELARKFEKDFNSEPGLRDAYQEFKRDAGAGKNPRAADFMARLRSVPAFEKLVNRWASAPGSGSVLMNIARQPEGRAFLKYDAPRAARGKQARAARSASAGLRAGGGSAGGAPRASALTGADLKGGAGAGGSATTSRAAAATTVGDDGRGTQASGAGAAIGGPGGGGPGALGTGVVGPAAGAAHNVNPNLGGIATPTTDPIAKLLEDYPFLGDIFTREELKALIDGTNENGLWGACFLKKKFKECYLGCLNAHPTATNKYVYCELPGKTGWKACMNAFDDDKNKCLDLCGSQPPCRSDALVWDAQCDPMPKPQGWAGRPDFCHNENWSFAGCTGSTEVCSLYGKYLGRLPEKGGALGWEAGVERLRAEGKSYDEIMRILRKDFADSLEAKMGRGEEVDPTLLEEQNKAYQAFLEEKRIKDGGSLCVDMTKCGTTADANLVTLLYMELLGREPDADGLKAWLLELGKGLRAGEIEDKIKSSEEYKRTHPGVASPN